MVPFTTAIPTGPEEAKQPQTITLPPSYFAGGILAWCVSSTSHVIQHTPSKKFNFSRGSLRCFWHWDKPLCYAVEIFEIFISKLAMKTIFGKSISYGGVMNTDLNWGKWGMQFFGCCGSFVNSSICCGTIVVILVGWPLLGRCSFFLFLSIVNNLSYYCWLESRSFRNGCISFYRRIYLNKFFFCSWISLDLSRMSGFWESFGLLTFQADPTQFLDWEPVWQ